MKSVFSSVVGISLLAWSTTGVADLDGGYLHHCGVKTDGNVACWGYNYYGQAPALKEGDFVQVSAGRYHTCGLQTDDNVACWGSNRNGQAPALKEGDFVQVSAGGSHTCGLQTDGNVACWGYNYYGQAPALKEGDFVQVSAGRYHTCGLQTDGNIACWGDNWNGQAPDEGDFIQVSTDYHTCGLQTDSNVACRGGNIYGEAPALKEGDFVQVSAAGQYHTCGLQTDGNIACWGANWNGQAPALKEGDFVQVSAGGHHTCGLQTDGSAVCWGDLASPPADIKFSTPFISVEIDIKPYSEPNSINLCTQGTVPVAILGSDKVDVNDIDPNTLALAEANVKIVGKKNPKSLCHLEYINTDGINDLVCQFLTTDLGTLDGTSTTADLSGMLYDGRLITGSDSVNIVKDDCN